MAVAPICAVGKALDRLALFVGQHRVRPKGVEGRGLNSGAVQVWQPGPRPWPV